MEYERYKSLRRLNSNFPPTQQRTMEYKSQRRPNSIFPPTQLRTMEYERYKRLRRPNSSCPPRLSVLFKTKLQVFLKKIEKTPKRPKYLETYRLHGILLHIRRKKHTGWKRTSEILRGMRYQTQTSSDLHQLPFKTLLLRRNMRKASGNSCHQNLGDFLCERGKWSGLLKKRKWELESQ